MAPADILPLVFKSLGSMVNHVEPFYSISVIATLFSRNFHWFPPGRSNTLKKCSCSRKQLGLKYIFAITLQTITFLRNWEYGDIWTIVRCDITEFIKFDIFQNKKKYGGQMLSMQFNIYMKNFGLAMYNKNWKVSLGYLVVISYFWGTVNVKYKLW